MGGLIIPTEEFFKKAKSSGCGKFALTGPTIPFVTLSLPSEN